mgnify:CR=1 FL=1|tara:strand:- start:99 stop:248 length:150 start_codon:yes stop_codon:yes gene_type:complete
MLEETIQNIIIETYLKKYVKLTKDDSEESKKAEIIKERLFTLLKRYKGE